MAVHPQAQKFLDLTSAIPPMDAQPVTESREAIAHALPGWAGAPVPVAEVSVVHLAGPGGDIAARLYRTRTDLDQPVVVYLHGGGWAVGSVAVFDATTRAIARAADAAVLSVDYRLAPEHVFPAAVEDALAATRAALAGQVLGVDPHRVAVAGSSAGGNLAAVVAQQLRHEPGLRHQVLIYPVTRGSTPETGTFAEYASGHFMTTRDMAFFYRIYAAGVPADHPYLAPLAAPDLSALPPATIVIAECDPLRDDGEDYAAALSAAGVPVALRRFPGQVHPFVYLRGLIDDAEVALTFVGTRLRAALLTG